MNLIPIVILVALVAIFILWHFFRGDDERPVRRSRSGNGENRSRRTPSEIERFLEEVNRRRQPPRSVEPVREGAGPVVKSSGRKTPGQRNRPQRERRPPEVAVIVEEVLPARAPSRFADPAPSPGAATRDAALQAAAVAPWLIGLAGLLASGDGLRAAVVLHEIFGPPRCRRRLHS